MDPSGSSKPCSTSLLDLPCLPFDLIVQKVVTLQDGRADDAPQSTAALRETCKRARDSCDAMIRSLHLPDCLLSEAEQLLAMPCRFAGVRILVAHVSAAACNLPSMSCM